MRQTSQMQNLNPCSVEQGLTGSEKGNRSDSIKSKHICFPAGTRKNPPFLARQTYRLCFTHNVQLLQLARLHFLFRANM